eukprot:6455181-Amphidinium_carterae.1
MLWNGLRTICVALVSAMGAFWVVFICRVGTKNCTTTTAPNVPQHKKIAEERSPENTNKLWGWYNVWVVLTSSVTCPVTAAMRQGREPLFSLDPTDMKNPSKDCSLLCEQKTHLRYHHCCQFR